MRPTCAHVYVSCIATGNAIILTFETVVDVHDLLPALHHDDVIERLRIERPHVELVAEVLAAVVDRHAARDERHLVGAREALHRVDGVDAVRAEQREDALLVPLTHCNTYDTNVRKHTCTRHQIVCTHSSRPTCSTSPTPAHCDARKSAAMVRSMVS